MAWNCKQLSGMAKGMERKCMKKVNGERNDKTTQIPRTWKSDSNGPSELIAPDCEKSSQQNRLNNCCCMIEYFAADVTKI